MMFKKAILWVGLMLCISTAFSQDIPQKSNKLVNDYTNTLSAADVQKLERKLVAYNDSTTTQIAIVIVETTGQSDINQYGVDLIRYWGIGTKEKNNGIAIIIAIKDRKMAIQTGYGAEGGLPDIITQQIIQNDMKPRFKAKDYYGGLDAATTNIMKSMKGEYKADASDGSPIGFIIIIVIVVLIIIFRKRGGGGGGGRIIGSRGGASPFWWFLAGNMLGGGGRSSGSDWGGFSGGGGGGGGGFGGFGGGSGGGGGSSGSW
jgi:uncharacterized protein